MLFGCQDATLYCLNAASGELAWKHEIQDQIRCSPTLVEGRAFLAGCDGQLHIVDVTKGAGLSSIPINSPTGVTPAVQEDRMSTSERKAARCSVSTGRSHAWSGLTSDERASATHSQFSGRHRSAVVDRRSHRSKSRHLPPRPADVLWTFPTKQRVDSSPVIVGQRVFVASADGRFYALDLQSGEELWQYRSGRRLYRLARRGGRRLVIANDEGLVYCFGKAEK